MAGPRGQDKQGESNRVGEFYVQYEYWFAAGQLVLAMFGMGATLSGRDFRDVVREPRAVTLGCAIQMLLVPLTTFLFLQLPGIHKGIAVGIALVAAIPGGTVSNIFTFFARGNSALSISITGLTTLACLLWSPIILALLISDYLPADFTMPTGQIIRDITLTLLLPLIAGMAYLYLYPASAPSLSKWSIRGSIVGIGLIVVGSLSAGRLDLDVFGLGSVFLVTAFTILLAAMAYLAPRVVRLSRPDVSAIQFEVIVRNVNLGVLIKASLFPASATATAHLGDMALFTLLLYGGLQLVVGGGLIGWKRRRTRR